jgi:methanogenic corrinoid protein MtbC1
MEVLKMLMLLNNIIEAILSFDDGQVMENVRKALAEGLEAKDIVVNGLAQGMIRVGERYERKELFVPDMLRASKAFNSGLNLVLPYFKSNGEDYIGKIVVGLIKGNTQDNGKNILKIILTAYGFSVIDLGKNVDPRVFVEKAKSNNVDAIGISIMTNSGSVAAKEVIQLLIQEGIRESFKVIIGGAAASEQLSKSIGSDGYAKDALAAKTLLESLLYVKSYA